VQRQNFVLITTHLSDQHLITGTSRANLILYATLFSPGINCGPGRLSGRTAELMDDSLNYGGRPEKHSCNDLLKDMTGSGLT